MKPAQDVPLRNILVIKLGALGDFIQALGPMAAIRKHHPQARLTLMTSATYAELGRSCGYFDEVWIDEKPRWFNIKGWMTLKNNFKARMFARVYDLQNNDRTAFYFRLFSAGAPALEWVGSATGASHQNDDPQRAAGHAFDGHVQTLARAGLHNIQIDSLEWMKGELRSFPLRRPYVLLIPGSSPSRLEKRWPTSEFARLANLIAQSGYQPILIGTRQEDSLLQQLALQCPDALNLCGQTALDQIVALAREASMTIGNDTGPMHIAAATGCPCLALFSRFSNPHKHKPLGENVQIIQKFDLADLSAEEVLQYFAPRHEPTLRSKTVH